MNDSLARKSKLAETSLKCSFFSITDIFIWRLNSVECTFGQQVTYFGNMNMAH